MEHKKFHHTTPVLLNQSTLLRVLKNIITAYVLPMISSSIFEEIFIKATFTSD